MLMLACIIHDGHDISYRMQFITNVNYIIEACVLPSVSVAVREKTDRRTVLVHEGLFIETLVHP